MPAGPTPEAARFDLLQGAHARAGRGGRRVLTRLLAVIALALVAHGAVLAADTLALRRIAEARGTALRSALSARVPDLPPSLPLDEALLRALPAAPAARGEFLPLLARVADVLSVQEVTLRDLSYSAEDGGLSLSVEAPDLPALQRVEDGLRGRGPGGFCGRRDHRRRLGRGAVPGHGRPADERERVDVVGAAQRARAGAARGHGARGSQPTCCSSARRGRCSRRAARRSPRSRGTRRRWLGSRRCRTGMRRSRRASRRPRSSPRARPATT